MAALGPTVPASRGRRLGRGMGCPRPGRYGDGAALRLRLGRFHSAAVSQRGPCCGYPGVMSAPRTFTAAVHREEDWYVAQCLEVDVASQGHTIDEALANLAEAVGLYLEEVDDPAQYVTSTPLGPSSRLRGAA